MEPGEKPLQPKYLYYKEKRGRKTIVTGPFPDDGYPIAPGTKLAEKMVRLPTRNLARATEMILEKKK